MKNTVKRLISIALALTLLFSLAACGGETSNSGGGDSQGGSTGQVDENGETISSKDTLTLVSAYSDPGNYNPWTQATAQSAVIQEMVFEPLVEIYGGDYRACLAESYEWVDDVTLELTIKEGILFHNGEEFTVEDAIFSNELSRTSPSHAAAWKMVDSIEKVDDTTIRYNLAYPDIDFLYALTQCKMTCQSYYEGEGDLAFGTHPIGTGCFMWDDYVSGDRVTLKFFEDYWGEHGTINNITVRFITETSQALIELESGNVDIMTADGSTVTSVEGNDAITIVKYASGLNEYCGFNFNSEKVQDIRVRQALAYAIDPEAIVTGARENIGTASYSITPPSYSFYLESAPDYYAHDPEEAASILAELGYSTENPLQLRLLTDTSAVRTLEAQQIKNMADAVGFDIEIATYESASVTSVLAGGDPNEYDIFIRAIGGLTSSPTYQLSTIFCCDATAANNNPSWFTVDSHEDMAEFDELFKTIKQTTDDEERGKLMEQYQQMEREMLLACWLVNQETVMALNSQLRGYQLAAGYRQLYNNCYFVEG